MDSGIYTNTSSTMGFGIEQDYEHMNNNTFQDNQILGDRNSDFYQYLLSFMPTLYY